MIVKVTPKFQRKFKKVAKKNIKLARETDKKVLKFLSDPENSSVRLHKISGQG